MNKKPLGRPARHSMNKKRFLFMGGFTPRPHPRSPHVQSWGLDLCHVPPLLSRALLLSCAALLSCGPLLSCAPLLIFSKFSISPSLLGRGDYSPGTPGLHKGAPCVGPTTFMHTPDSTSFAVLANIFHVFSMEIPMYLAGTKNNGNRPHFHSKMGKIPNSIPWEMGKWDIFP